MSAAAVRDFIRGRRLYCYDPKSGSMFATVTYDLDGACVVRFEDGREDRGTYGFDANQYWTQYNTFRSGERHVFYLIGLGDGIAQAYFADGRKALLQCHKLKKGAHTPDRQRG